ncbi:MBL fold metallo-hydrolase [Rossellomorea vietnamensis]|uniref:MBL fold metallo-hydrolase n=2 Tax=Rossellomorea TaxID=2837508 RepID=A0A5D4KCK6_9BACI|nr:MULTISPECIES: MBL fold metallo-hydrolase [Rossellomorea]TYR75058.1 MBL fold metallo-hydrolase [Rossellomorea vietnamensis]TYS79814.1 MBL fold metallo-hydrolase [Rossellomorea aquimaris]
MSVKEISTKELTQKVLSKEKVFIVDVRNTDAFDDWKVEGRNVEVINAPYTEIKEKSIDSFLDKLPESQTIHVICAKGNSSLKAANLIAEAGYTDVYSITGGMSAWSEHLEPIKIGELKGGGTIHQFVRIGKGCLSYLIQSNGEAAIVDAARMTEPYRKILAENDIKLTRVLDTHLHADHISGGRELAENSGAEYFLPPKDAEDLQFSYEPVKDGDQYEVGYSIIKALYSPGHTIGSTSYIIDDQFLLTGDILFIDSIGRPDLAGKAEDWVGDLRTTLYRRYKDLDENLIVLPAHYMGINEMNEDGSISSKLGTLYQENHGLNIDEEEEFRKIVSENLPPQPNSYEEIRRTNMGKESPDEDQQTVMETGPNRCAVR